MSEVAQTLGQRLKAERERRAMSTQKAADEMHLDAWVIDALEAGDYQRIGPAVYAKGHLKKYASILGLPASEITAGYETQAPAPPAAPPLASMRIRSASTDPTHLPWPQLAAVAVLALAVGGILWWRPWHQHSSTSAAGRTHPLPSAAAPVAATSDELPAPRSPVSAGGAPSGGASGGGPSEAAAGGAGAAGDSTGVSTPSASMAAPVLAKGSGTANDANAMLGVGRARLRLSFSADSWVDVHDAAGRRVFAGKGRANSVRSIVGAAPLRVYLGFASGVQLEVNGRAVAIGPQFVAGDVARFEAGADGVLRRDSRAAIPTNGVQTPTTPPRG